MKKIDTIKIGKNLKKIRNSFGYTQEQLAEKIECSTRHISDIEQDRAKPSYEILIRICNLYKISIEDIFIDYLNKQEKRKINYELLGYETLEQKDKNTIVNLITYFNTNKNNTD